MNFLKTLFWVVLAVAAAAFSFNNWDPVTVKLWAGLQVDFKLPLLLFLAFLLGLLPTFILHRATRWSLRRRLDSAERALADTRAFLATPAAAPPGEPLAVPPPAIGPLP